MSIQHDPQLPSPSSDQSPGGVAASTPHPSTSTRPRPITACLTCRNRKIKCDRNFPCNNCIKSERDCRYDTSTVAAAARPTGVTKNHAPPGGHHHATKTEGDLQRRITRLEEMLSASVEKLQAQPTVDLGVEVLPRAASQLQITEGRTRYLGPLAWITAVGDEIGDLKQQVHVKNPQPSPMWPTQWLLPHHSPDMATKLLSYIPVKEHSDTLYSIYLDRIVVQSPIIHKPTLYAAYLEFWSGTMPPSKRPPFIAMLFSIYHAAVFSLDPDTCLRVCGQDRNSQIELYKDATQQALVEADFLRTEELLTLQAMTTLAWIYVTRGRQSGMWVLISICFRIARTMGLHRDPSNFPSIPPAEGEIRRRLWYEIFHLETYSGIQESPYISEDSFDTQTPRNLNDADLENVSSNGKLPDSRLEYTDTSHFLFRVAMNKHFIRGLELTSGIKRVKKEDFQRLIRDIQDWGSQWETYWLPTYRDEVPMERMAKKTSRLLLNKAILVLYYPFSKPKDKKLLPTHIRESALTAACKTIECHNDLISDPALSKYVYYFASYNQFLSLAILLGELIDNPATPRQTRIWSCVDRMFTLAGTGETVWVTSGPSSTNDVEGGSGDWAAVRSLYEQAIAKRTEWQHQRQLQRQATNGGVSGGGSVSGASVSSGSKVMEEIEGTSSMGEIDWDSWDKMVVEGMFDDFLLHTPPKDMVAVPGGGREQFL